MRTDNDATTGWIIAVLLVLFAAVIIMSIGSYLSLSRAPKTAPTPAPVMISKPAVKDLQIYQEQQELEISKETFHGTPQRDPFRKIERNQ